MNIKSADYKIVAFNPEQDVYRICVGYCICYNTPIPETYKEQCEFIRKHINHESPLEHSSMSVLFDIDRGVSHELVRHRHTSYSQESTRYCNYSKDRFGNQLTFIGDSRLFLNKNTFDIWVAGREEDEKEYLSLLAAGQKPEEARGCLPNDLATRLLVTTNYREWRSIFKLRCDKHSHYKMREVMIPLFDKVCSELPCVFEDIKQTIQM